MNYVGLICTAAPWRDNSKRWVYLNSMTQAGADLAFHLPPCRKGCWLVEILVLSYCWQDPEGGGCIHSSLGSLWSTNFQLLPIPLTQAKLAATQRAGSWINWRVGLLTSNQG